MKLVKRIITKIPFLLILSCLFLLVFVVFIMFYKMDSYVDNEGVIHDDFRTMAVPLLVFLASLVSVVVLLCVMLYRYIRRNEKLKEFKRIAITVLVVGVVIYGIKISVDLSFQGTDKIKIIENFDEISTIDELIHRKEFQNKVLYIDVWGVFCSPCIAEFKSMPKLKKQWANKNIAFIYVALPYDKINDLQLWKSAIKEYNLEGFNMLVNPHFMEEIWKFTEKIAGIRAIPHYIIVDKNGNVSNPNAPRPSLKDELSKEINKLL